MDYDKYLMENVKDMSVEELEALRDELQDSMDFEQAETDDIVIEENQEELQSEVTTGNLEAIAKGVGEGFTGGFLGEAKAAVSALEDTIKLSNQAVQEQSMKGFANALSSYGEQYHKHHRMYEDELKQLEKDHPGTFGVSEVVGALGGAATIAALGPVSAVGALAAMGAYSFVHGAGKSNAETLGGRLKAGAKGAVIDTAIGGGVGIAGRAARSVGKGVSKVLGPSQLVNYLSGSLKNFRNKFDIFEDVYEYADRMVKYNLDVEQEGVKKTINVLQSSHTAEQSLAFVRKATKQTNAELTRMYGEIDRVAPLSSDTIENITNRMNDDVLQGVSDVAEGEAGSQAFVKLREQLRSKLDKDFYTNHPDGKVIKLADGSTTPLRVPKSISVPRLNKIKNEYHALADTGSKTAEFGDLTLAPHWKKAANIIDDLLDEHIHANSGLISSKIGIKGKAIGEAAEEAGEGFYDLWKTTKTKSRDLRLTKELLHDRLKNPSTLDWARGLVRNHVHQISLGAAAATMVTGAPIQVVGAVAGGIHLLAKSDRIQKGAALGLTKIATSMEKNPARYSKLAMRLAVAMDVSSEAFYERVLQAGAEVDLSEKPLLRSMEDVMSRQDSILTLARVYDPKISKDLQQAINNGDANTVGRLLTSSDKLAKFISGGLGWEGRALSTRDMEAVMKYIKGLKPADRRRATMEFQKNQMIPTKMLTGENAKAAEIQVLYKLGKKAAQENDQEDMIPIGVRAPEL